jgi:hypothetical protein
MSAFLRDFDMYFCKLFDGARHDSGDPFQWGERMLAHYANRVDPQTKTLIFSDGLTVPRTIELYQQFRGPLPAGLRHRHQPHQRPGLRAAADRHQDDPLQRPAGGQAVGHPPRTCATTRNTWPTCARCSRSREQPAEKIMNPGKGPYWYGYGLP